MIHSCSFLIFRAAAAVAPRSISWLYELQGSIPAREKEAARKPFSTADELLIYSSSSLQEAGERRNISKNMVRVSNAKLSSGDFAVSETNTWPIRPFDMI